MSGGQIQMIKIYLLTSECLAKNRQNQYIISVTIHRSFAQVGIPGDGRPTRNCGLCKVALSTGAPREYGTAGPGRHYRIKAIRQREMACAKHAEKDRERMAAA
jgi:hypothetical protein